MNKKGLVVDAIEFIIVSATIIFLILIVFIIISLNISSKINKFNLEQSKIDASRNTRILLEYELQPEYKLYQAIIDGVNSGDENFVNNAIIESINKAYGDSSTEAWIFIINGRIASYKLNKIPNDVINYLPRTNIPNPEGTQINVLIKRVVPEDYYEPNALEKLANRMVGGRSNIAQGFGGQGR